MRHLIFTDVHGDIDALDRVTQCAKKQHIGGYDDIWCLGDVLGRCDPKKAGECIQWLYDRNATCIKGNWEWWVLTPEYDPDKSHPSNDKHDTFRRRHLAELYHFRKWLESDKVPSYLRDYLLTWQDYIPFSTVTLVHGSPLVCEFEDQYHCSIPSVEKREHVIQIFGRVAGNRCSLYFPIKTQNIFVGHKHVPHVFLYNPSNNIYHDSDPFKNESRQHSVSLKPNGTNRIIRLGTLSNSKSTYRDGFKFPTAAVYDDENEFILLFEVK